MLIITKSSQESKGQTLASSAASVVASKIPTKFVSDLTELLLAVVETALQLIFNIFEWPQKALKLWVKIAQNILVQIGLKWLHINTFS